MRPAPLTKRLKKKARRKAWLHKNFRKGMATNSRGRSWMMCQIRKKQSKPNHSRHENPTSHPCLFVWQWQIAPRYFHFAPTKPSLKDDPSLVVLLPIYIHSPNNLGSCRVVILIWQMESLCRVTCHKLSRHTHLAPTQVNFSHNNENESSDRISIRQGKGL